MSIMHRCGACCFEEFSSTTPSQCGKPHGGEWWTKRRGTNSLGMIDPEKCGQDTDGWDARGLPLVGTSGDRGVALDVFDRAQTRTGGTQNIGDRLVTLQIDIMAVVVFDFCAA